MPRSAPPTRPPRPPGHRRAAKPTRRLRDPGRPRTARRLPDLHVLPPLLHASGAFAALRQRLGTESAPLPAGGRHASLAAVPHGAKTFLAAAARRPVDGRRRRGPRAPDRPPAAAGSGSAGSPATPRSAIAWPRSCSRGSAIQTRVAVLEPRSSLAYERSELVRDETAARVAALAPWRSGRARVLVASVQALLQHTLDPAEVPAEPRRLRVGARLHQDQLLRELLALGYDPVLEVAGRGEFARRGGLVDVFPSAAPLPIRIELFGDEIDSMRAFDPADQRSLRPVEEVVLLPASEFLVPAGGIAEIRARLAAAARPPRGRLPERLAADLARFEEGVHAGTGRAGRAFGPRPRHRRVGPRARDRRRGRGLGRRPVPRDRPGSRARRDAPRPGRAGRHRRRGRLPVAPGAGAPRRAGRRAAICRSSGRRPTWARASGSAASCAAGPWS